MEQSLKNIGSLEQHLAMIGPANVQMLDQGNYAQVYQNLCVALTDYFDIALHRWRRAESPVAAMEAALATSKDLLAAITNWQLDDETLNGYGDVWNLVSCISYLLGQPVELPEQRLVGIRKDLSENAADVALDYLVMDALEGQDWREGLAEPMGRLAAKKRQMLAVETYKTYFDLLDLNGDPERTESLVRLAEANYKKRARDSFYGGGPTYTGGGPDNPYVVDFVLAAILKHIKWSGETIHKWNW
jgi:hypothetical protein